MFDFKNNVTCPLSCRCCFSVLNQIKFYLHSTKKKTSVVDHRAVQKEKVYISKKDTKEKKMTAKQ